MIKLGLMASLLGPFKVLGEDGVRGAKLALQEYNYHAGGHDLELLIEATNITPMSALAACDTLREQDVKLFIGPLSGNEALAVRQYANEHPDYVFVNGAAGSQPMFNPAKNFFMFNPTGAQLVSGLGKYAYDTLGYRKILTIGEAYSFPFAQIGGFALEFVNSGGTITEYKWCAVGVTDYTDIINQIPNDVDAVFSALSGDDGLHFIDQFLEIKGKNTPLIAGSMLVDQSVLNSITQNGELLVGVVSANTHVDDLDTNEWRKFVDAYRKAYADDGFYSPSYFAFAYYVNTKAALLALEQTNGNLSQMPAALQALTFTTPTGEVHLDHHRVAVTDIFVMEIRQNTSGGLYTHLLQRAPQTNCTLGFPDDEYMEIGDFNQQKMPGMQESFADMMARIRRQAKDKNDH